MEQPSVGDLMIALLQVKGYMRVGDKVRTVRLDAGDALLYAGGSVSAASGFPFLTRFGTVFVFLSGLSKANLTSVR